MKIYYQHDSKMERQAYDEARKSLVAINGTVRLIYKMSDLFRIELYFRDEKQMHLDLLSNLRLNHINSTISGQLDMDMRFEWPDGM